MFSNRFQSVMESPKFTAFIALLTSAYALQMQYFSQKTFRLVALLYFTLAAGIIALNPPHELTNASEYLFQHPVLLVSTISYCFFMAMWMLGGSALNQLRLSSKRKRSPSYFERMLGLLKFQVVWYLLTLLWISMMCLLALMGVAMAALPLALIYYVLVFVLKMAHIKIAAGSLHAYFFVVSDLSYCLFTCFSGLLFLIVLLRAYYRGD